ncbi:MAG: metal ABC transporter substrate-binding protein [Negativicutes bacterium]|nr:metal ABC transporter substrate-binding protein [Negativicutes bacterium]
MRKFFCIALAILMLAIMSGCLKKEAPRQTVAVPKLKVVATVYPVYEFTRQVGGDRIELAMLVPAGTEPHEWEPSSKDLVRLRGANLVIYQGSGFEQWIGKFLTKEIMGGATAIEASQGIHLLQTDMDEHHHASHAPGHGDTDPHVWLDPLLAQQEVRNIAAALAAADSTNKEYYFANAANYIAELDKLHQEFQMNLSGLKQRKIVTNHAAFGYLAKRYSLEQLAIMGLSPDAEPTPEKMAKVIKAVREHQVKYIFAETVLSSKLAATIARETGARVLVLHPIDQLTEAEMNAGQNYLTLMRANLSNLKKSLGE